MYRREKSVRRREKLKYRGRIEEKKEIIRRGKKHEEKK